MSTFLISSMVECARVGLVYRNAKANGRICTLLKCFLVRLGLGIFFVKDVNCFADCTCSICWGFVGVVRFDFYVKECLDDTTVEKFMWSCFAGTITDELFVCGG